MENALQDAIGVEPFVPGDVKGLRHQGEQKVAIRLCAHNHDAEIFEDSEVDRIYRFTMSVDGSLVSTE